MQALAMLAFEILRKVCPCLKSLNSLLIAILLGAHRKCAIRLALLGFDWRMEPVWETKVKQKTM